jgi:hypothetical protein
MRQVQKLGRESAPCLDERDVHQPHFGWILIGAAVALVTISPKQMMPNRTDANLLARELVTDHVRSLMVSHLMDVASSDQHTVKLILFVIATSRWSFSVL